MFLPELGGVRRIEYIRDLWRWDIKHPGFPHPRKLDLLSVSLVLRYLFFEIVLPFLGSQSRCGQLPPASQAESFGLPSPLPPLLVFPFSVMTRVSCPV